MGDRSRRRLLRQINYLLNSALRTYYVRSDRLDTDGYIIFMFNYNFNPVVDKSCRKLKIQNNIRCAVKTGKEKHACTEKAASIGLEGM